MGRLRHTLGAGIATLSVTASAHAQAAADTNERPVQLTLGLDYTSQYFFRGLLQEDDGIIVQPYADITLTLYNESNRTFSLSLGTWSSVHSEEGSAGTTDDNRGHLYETDWYAVVEAGFDKVSVGLTYTSYTSPSDAFSTVDELMLGIAYDDSADGLLLGLPLEPSVSLAFEMGDAAADGQENGIYLGLSLSPEWELDPDGSGLALSVPVTVGLSLSDYYEDENGDDNLFGYLDVGLDLALPIVADDQWGSVDLVAGVHLLFIGDTATDLNSGDDTEVYATIGVSWTY